MANLLHLKGTRNKVLTQFPTNNFGNDGDIVVVSTKGRGVYLCIKSGNRWHAANKLQDLQKLEKTSLKTLKLEKLKVGNTTITNGEYDVFSGDFTLDVAGDIELNADGGQVTIKDGIANHFLFDCDLTRFRIFDDANVNDHFTILVGAEGITTLTTVDADTTVAHLTLDADGDIILDAASGNITVKDNGGNYTPSSDYHIATKKYVDDNEANTMGSGFTVSATTDSNATTITQGDDLMFTAGTGITCETTADGTVTISNTVSAPTNYITNDAADIMAVSDFGANAALKIDADQPATAGAEDSKGLWIDYDRIVAGSGTANHHDIGIDLDVNTASLGTSSVKGIDIDVVGATSGTHTAYGITVNVSGSDSNLGILSNVTNGGIDFKCLSSANTGDFFTINTTTNGETTLATTDADAALAHINLDADGEIRLDAGDFGASDGIQFLAAGTKIADFTAHHAYSELRLYENQGASTDDYAFFQSHVNGATILGTKDDAGASAHLSLQPDGDLIFNANSQNIYTRDSAGVYNPIVKTHTVSFTEAEVNNFHSAPQVLLAAQGANKVIVPTSMLLFVTRDGSTAQSNSSCDLTIGYDGAVGVGHVSYYVRRFMYNESGSRIIQVVGGFGYDVGQSLTEGDDADLTIAVDSAVTSGSIDAIKAVFSYYVFDNS